MERYFNGYAYVIFRKETPGHLYYPLVGGGRAKGLPHQTLEVVEGKARRFIESLDGWDATKTSAHISIYEVLNLLSINEKYGRRLEAEGRVTLQISRLRKFTAQSRSGS